LKTCQNPPESGSDKTPYPSQHPPALCRRQRLSRPLASIFRLFFQTLILTLNLNSRGVPLEALGAALAPKGSPEAPKCLQKVTQNSLQSGFGEMLFLMTPPMKMAHFGVPGGSEMELKRRPRNDAAQRCSKMLPEALQRSPRCSRGRLWCQNGLQNGPDSSAIFGPFLDPWSRCWPQVPPIGILMPLMSNFYRFF